jgi:3-methyladenine DNA glycosylase/8-oxoguanine DNA glycosylase
MRGNAACASGRTGMSSTKNWKGAPIYTIGHSTRTFDELVAIVRAFGISMVVDIRTIPRSRHNPQFNGDVLRTALRSKRLRYVHVSELGGLRRPRKDSSNTGWRNASFRGFADHMLTESFERGLAKLQKRAEKGPVVLMCAEAVPWRCHRFLVADALTARGARVEHITSAKRASPHVMSTFAEVNGVRVTYPGEHSAGARLATRGPFHLEATVRVLQRRPTNLVDVWAEDCYRRVLTTADGLALVEVVNRGSIDDPDVRWAVLQGDISTAARTALGDIVTKMLGLDIDPRPLQRLAHAEPRLGATAIALRGMRPPRFAALFETVARVVPFQQLSLDAGEAVVGRLVQRFGAVLARDGRRFHAFPTAQVIADARLPALKKCGVSLRKAETLRRIARMIESREITEEKLSRMSTKEAIRSLTELPGIGPWSASLIMLRGMGRLDVFPPGDVGVIRGLSQLMRVEPGRSLERVVRRFGDQRGYLYFYSLGSALLARGLIHSAPLRE